MKHKENHASVLGLEMKIEDRVFVYKLFGEKDKENPNIYCQK